MTKDVLIIEARFYDHLADMGLKGATAELDALGLSYDVITVPGALEIPLVLGMTRDSYKGFVALGCVIRGETTHYDLVSNESFRGIYDLATVHNLCVGNGIQTVENEAQAIARLDPAQKNKGAGAVRAMKALMDVKAKYNG